jgi:hypothetical protein
MGLWNKKKKETPPNPMALWLKEKTARLKAHWALAMAKLAARLSLQQQKATTILFCLLVSAYCVFLIVQGLTESSKTIVVPVRAISKPVAPKGEVLQSSFESEREHVTKLISMMDSLQQDTRGRVKYDSIRRFRPGLLDTLKILEQYYKNE